MNSLCHDIVQKRHCGINKLFFYMSYKLDWLGTVTCLRNVAMLTFSFNAKLIANKWENGCSLFLLLLHIRTLSNVTVCECQCQVQMTFKD